MRPVHLRLAGFTAFRDEQQIDFGDLELFAITGPTGSGKSSILDAMTYVLFGKVERVGDRVSQLISQGQPAMSVELTFSIDDAQFRVTRRTSITAPTRILLERDTNSEWEQYGPGADRVRDAEASIRSLLGLDYDAFTRSILLPQGKFQQFLTGDAAERRRILSDLLGLDIYRRMASTAGELAAEARGLAEARRETLAAEYADVSAETLAASRERAAAALKQELRIATISAEVERIAEQAQADEQRAIALNALEGDVRGVAKRAADALPRIDTIGQAMGLAHRAVTEAAKRAAGASEAVEAARRDLAAAEATHGRNTELAAQLALLSERRAFGTQLDQLIAERDGLQAGESAAEEAQRAATTVAERAAANESAARVALAESVAAREHMAQRHAVAALLVGAEAGDPCPVCGASMATLPDAPGSTEVAETESAHRSAQQAAAAAEKATRNAAEALTSQRAAVAAQAHRRDELAAAIAEVRERLVVRDEQLAPLLGAGDLDAAAQTIQTRLAALSDLSAAISAAEATARDRDVSLAAEREAVARLRGELQTEQVRLRELATSELSARVTDAVPGTTPPGWPALAEQLDTPDELASAAAAIVTGCDELRAAVLAELAEVSQRAAAYREQAFTAATDYAGDATDLATLRRELGSAHRAATAQVATTEAAAADMSERLERRGSMEVEARAAEQRAAVMRTLAQALRSDRLVAFVQAEALEALASSATRHLAELSDGRYRLACRANDFEVIDTWNGEERRSVRTLSGGETFLASLALALALAEQVSAIGMAQRVRLDSLFLDEGFGTLDAESLDTVIAAINVLGADGRMVGVVSHVAELAESLPMRLEVSKSPRGSRISRIDTAVPSP